MDVFCLPYMSILLLPSIKASLPVTRLIFICLLKYKLGLIKEKFYANNSMSYSGIRQKIIPEGM